MNSEEVERLLIAHTDAWNSHNIERLMSLFADDCVFDASGGHESHGRRFVGQDQVKTAFADVLDSMPDANWAALPEIVQLTTVPTVLSPMTNILLVPTALTPAVLFRLSVPSLTLSAPLKLLTAEPAKFAVPESVLVKVEPPPKMGPL